RSPLLPASTTPPTPATADGSIRIHRGTTLPVDGNSLLPSTTHASRRSHVPVRPPLRGAVPVRRATRRAHRVESPLRQPHRPVRPPLLRSMRDATAPLRPVSIPDRAGGFRRKPSPRRGGVASLPVPIR